MRELNLIFACSCYIQGNDLYLLMTALLMPMPFILVGAFSLFFYKKSKDFYNQDK